MKFHFGIHEVFIKEPLYIRNKSISPPQYLIQLIVI